MKIFSYCLSLIAVLSACDPEPSQDVVTIPLRYERNLYLSCRINDTQKANIMFDTGAYGLFLDSMFSQNMSLVPANMPASTFTACSVAPYTVVNGLPFKFFIQSIPYYFQNLRIIKAKSTFGKQCDGIAGWDLFAGRVVHIDYKRASMKIMNAVDFEPDASYTRIPLVLRHNMFFVNMEVTVSDRLKIAGDYLLDLGYGGSIYLTSETANRYQLDTVKTKKVEFAADWGMFERRRASGYVLRGSSLRLDSLHLDQPLIDCSKDADGILSSGEYAGLIGNRALEHFDVIIDLANAILYLKPNADHIKRMEFKTPGFGGVDRTDICDGFIINSIYDVPGCPPVKPGDIITDINGQAVKKDPERLIKKLSEVTGKTMEITVNRNGKALTFDVMVQKAL